MSRRKEPTKMEGGVPEEMWDLDPLPPSNRKRRPKVVKETRERVYARDNYRCRMCGNSEDLTIDHIRPLSKGGSNRESNMQTLCDACNLSKGSTIKGGQARRRSSSKPLREPRPKSRLAWAYSVLGLTEADFRPASNRPFSDESP